MNDYAITPFRIDDHVGAWTPHGRFVIEGAASGPLAGLTFAAKDLFDVAGHPTGAGNIEQVLGGDPPGAGAQQSASGCAAGRRRHAGRQDPDR